MGSRTEGRMDPSSQRRLGLRSPHPAPPDGLVLALGAVGRCVHFSMGVVWAFLLVFVFSEELGEMPAAALGLSAPKKASGWPSLCLFASLASAGSSPVQSLRFSVPSLRRGVLWAGLSPSAVGPWEGFPFPAGRGILSSHTLIPFLPASPSGSALPSSLLGRCRAS